VRHRRTTGRGLLLRAAFSVILLAGTVSCADSKPSGTTGDAVRILSDSRDRRELKNAALLLAASRSPEDHRVLGKFLRTAGFLGRLDSPQEYAGTYRDLRLGRVVQTLADNRCPSADEVLLSLVDSGDFQGHILRIQLLLRALGAVRPSPPQVIAYWDRLSDPESPIVGDVIEALCINQSPPALDLLERKFADPAQDRDARILWMREFLLVRRNDEPLLLSCERMATKSLPADLRPSLVEVLFDYRREEWFRSEMSPKPPPRAEASPAARSVLERIGRYALENLKLTSAQASAVRNGLAELGK